jgi:hypothetical protein
MILSIITPLEQRSTVRRAKGKDNIRGMKNNVKKRPGKSFFLKCPGAHFKCAALPD